MKAKSILALGLTAVMLTSLAACGGGENEVKDKTGSSQGAGASGKEINFPLKEKASYSVFCPMVGGNEMEDNISIKTLLDGANIEFKYQEVMEGDFAEKRNLVINSGDYPDIFFKSNPDLDKYGKQGVFIPLEDMIKEYAPNFTKKMDELDGWGDITSGDGHIYSLPEINRKDPGVIPYWINKQWLKNLNLKEPTSLDELYDVLKAFKEEDANGNGDPDDEIPFLARDDLKPELLLPYFEVGYDSWTRSALIDDKMTYLPTSDIYKEYVEFTAKLYQEGLLDKNSFTQKAEQQNAIGHSGDVLGSFFDAGAFLTVGRDRDKDYKILTPFEENSNYPLKSGITPGALVITDKCENPETIIAWADQLYTEEGGITATLGIEGKTWEKRDDGDWEWIVGGDYGDTIEDVRQSSTFVGGGNHPAIWPDFWYNHMSPDTDPNEVYLNEERARIAEKGTSLPVMQYSDEDMSTISTLKTDIDSYVDQYVAQVATGALDLEKSWKDYTITLDDMGAGQLNDIYQKAYEEGLKNS